MRGGAKLGCVVNGMAGKEHRFEGAEPPRGERIAVVGAGPAGLTYASLVADENTVTIFERDATAGGAFRYTGKVPLFEEVEADEQSFRVYIERMVQSLSFRRPCGPQAAGWLRPDRDRHGRTIPFGHRRLAHNADRRRHRPLAGHS